MIPGKINTYINERLANLLSEHGPEGDGNRALADKLNYIVPGWDRILRDEKVRWRASLTKEEWLVCQSCTLSHAFGMDTGAPLEMDVGAVLACVEDTLDSEIMLDDAARWRDSTVQKLRPATVAAQLALVWMLLRERDRA